MRWIRQPTGTREQLLGVGCRAGEAFAVGTRGAIRRWDGRAWSAEDSPTDEDLYAVSCTNDAVVAVGGNLHIGGSSLILHFDASTWIAEPSGMQHILLAVARAPSGWFAAGYNGGIVRGRPGSWTQLDVAHYSHVFALAANGGRLFAAGLSGTILEFVGDRWRPHAAPSAAHLRGMCPFGEREFLAVGLTGVILRYDGQGWAAMESTTTAHLEAVWAASEREAYAVGYAGTVLGFDGARWSALALPEAANLQSVHGNADEVIAVGGEGAAFHLHRA